MPKQKLDLVCTHIPQHLNICIECHYCDKSYWSAKGWKRHTGSVHPGLPKVPEGTEDPATFTPLGDAPAIAEVRDEEEEAINRALDYDPSELNVEQEFSLVDVEDAGMSGTTAPMDV